MIFLLLSLMFSISIQANSAVPMYQNLFNFVSVDYLLKKYSIIEKLLQDLKLDPIH